jgi:hypothetical protein
LSTTIRLSTKITAAPTKISKKIKVTNFPKAQSNLPRIPAAKSPTTSSKTAIASTAQRVPFYDRIPTTARTTRTTHLTNSELITTLRPVSLHLFQTTRRTTVATTARTSKQTISTTFQPRKVKRMFSSVNCGDKECNLRHQILKDCTVYLHTNNSDCSIPCKMNGCKKELYHFINCPIWQCRTLTTTSTTSTLTPPTTTQFTTTSAMPTPFPNTNGLLFSSIGLNVFFVKTQRVKFNFLICIHMQ